MDHACLNEHVNMEETPMARGGQNHIEIAANGDHRQHMVPQ
jgi:hypothetical protein